jgi:hypothetical protein
MLLSEALGGLAGEHADSPRPSVLDCFGASMQGLLTRALDESCSDQARQDILLPVRELLGKPDSFILRTCTFSPQTLDLTDLLLRLGQNCGRRVGALGRLERANDSPVLFKASFSRTKIRGSLFDELPVFANRLVGRGARRLLLIERWD